MSLVELIIASSLSGILLVGVLSTTLTVTKSGYLLRNYIDMEKEARAALETIAVDARVTKKVSWQLSSDGATLTGITLIDPASKSVTYTYDSAQGTLKRTEGTTTRTLVTGIQSLRFTAWKYDNSGAPAEVPATSATLVADTKMIQISLSALRTRSTLAAATNNVVSARYVLRNKSQYN